MVLAERNTELVRNGRRSRGPSPNNGHGSVGTGSGVGGGGGGGGSGGGGGAGVGGNVNNNNATSINVGGAGTPETSSDDDNSIKRNGKSKTKQSEYEEKIRVGRDYQAICPPLVPEPERKPEILNDRALLVWSPTKDIPDSKLEEYISVAKEKYGYNGEQALGMLFWHKHDLERAVVDLSNFTPFPDEWTVEDKVLFEQAFQFHGKSFHRIRQMLPDKSIASLVKYYYSWKKTRHRQSVMDRQEKAKASKEGSENGSENGSNEESDNDDKIQLNKQIISQAKRKNAENIQDIRPPESTNRISSRWTNDELLLAVQGVRKYGKDFQLIADILGTKTEANVRTFYVNYRRRYNLDEVLKQYEADKEAQASSVSASTSTSSTLIDDETSSTAASTTAAASSNATITTAASKKDEIKKKENAIEKAAIKTDTLLSSNSKTGTIILNEKLATNAPAKLPAAMHTDHDIKLVNNSDIIMEIDLDDDPMDVVQQPPAKKLAITDNSAQDMPKASMV